MGRRGNVFIDDEAECSDDGSEIEIEEEGSSDNDKDSKDLKIGEEPVASQLHAWRKYEATKLGKKPPAHTAATVRPALKRSRATYNFEEEERRAPEKKKSKKKGKRSDPEFLLQILAGQISKVAGDVETAAFAAKAVGTLSGLRLNQAVSTIAGQEILNDWDADDHSEEEIIGTAATLKFLAGELRKLSAALSCGTPAYSNCQKQIKNAVAQARED